MEGVECTQHVECIQRVECTLCVECTQRVECTLCAVYSVSSVQCVLLYTVCCHVQGMHEEKTPQKKVIPDV